jgi:hypothetical protein
VIGSGPAETLKNGWPKQVPASSTNKQPASSPPRNSITAPQAIPTKPAMNSSVSMGKRSISHAQHECCRFNRHDRHHPISLGMDLGGCFFSSPL